MNIVMVGPFGLHPKGTVKMRALPLAKALVERGHQVSLLVPPWDHPDDSGREWQEDGVQVINARLPIRLPLWFHLLLTLRLVRYTLRLKPDVVHCFKPKAYAGLTHFVLWWLRRVRFITRRIRLVVDTDDWEQAWNSILSYPVLQQRFFTRQERWGLRHADAVTAASRELVKLVEQEGVPTSNVYYLPNGVERELADHASQRPDAVRMLWELDDAPVILLYTRFLEFRMERIVAIMQRVLAHVPAAKLLVVGEGLFAEEAEMDDVLAAGGLADNAVFTGWVPADQLSEHFSASDVAIFPYDDTLINRTKCSVKLIDLLVSGLPVVADAVGQNQEYIRNEETGLLVDPEDDTAFADAVVRLLNDPQLRSRLGAAAANDVRSRFAWFNLAETTEKAYR